MQKAPVLERPVDNKFKVWQRFGEIRPETTWAYAEFGGQHSGVDFYMPAGNKISCSFEGVVVRREWHQGMGNVVGVRNGNIVTLYAHLSKFEINLGEIVGGGDLVGLSGNTGAATLPDVPHLHFELRDLTRPILKEMIFEPEFGRSIKQWQDAFAYVVNNTSTPKTWGFLAERYLGDVEKYEDIIRANPKLSFGEGERLPDGLEVVIPNFLAKK
ncbi:MAG: M23 family metallopeptidase [Patescibacteria group bacterium]|nr:M23 family metallopeptidase [Patescibacteria group bacterium]